MFYKSIDSRMKLWIEWTFFSNIVYRMFAFNGCIMTDYCNYLKPFLGRIQGDFFFQLMDDGLWFFLWFLLYDQLEILLQYLIQECSSDVRMRPHHIFSKDGSIQSKRQVREAMENKVLKYIFQLYCFVVVMLEYFK